MRSSKDDWDLNKDGSGFIVGQYIYKRVVKSDRVEILERK